MFWGRLTLASSSSSRSWSSKKVIISIQISTCVAASPWWLWVHIISGAAWASKCLTSPVPFSRSSMISRQSTDNAFLVAWILRRHRASLPVMPWHLMGLFLVAFLSKDWNFSSRELSCVKVVIPDILASIKCRVGGQERLVRKVGSRESYLPLPSTPF